MNQAASTPDDELTLWRVRTQLILLRGALSQGEPLESWLQRHPVLHTVLDDAAAIGLLDLTLEDGLARLDQILLAGANPAPGSAHPTGALSRLRHALNLELDGLSAWVAVALPDDDPRLGPFIDELHGQGGRVTRATLVRCLGRLPCAAALQTLLHAGLILPPSAGQAGLSAHPALWALACGLPAAPGTWVHQPAHTLRARQDLILPPNVEPWMPAAPTPGEPRAWVLRGPRGSGRHAVAGALARERGMGLIEACDAHSLPTLGAAAALLGAMPVVSFEPAPGERLQWVAPAGCPSDVALRLPRHGGIGVEGRTLITLELPAPDADERRRHWRQALHGREPDAALVNLRLPRGTLHRTAQAVTQTAHLLHGRDLADAVQAQLDEAGRFALDGIAHRMPPLHPNESLALQADTQDEFDTLVSRCLHRDQLAASLPAAFGHTQGVRALFKGASGTGKTLAARHLAHALGRPLYRVDLAATVSKYIGETERNLERVFEAAESLDVVLLLDEGDALMAGRTQVSNATDRYANLETNYLLQRLEHHQGVLVVTTNAAERIDGAFARRMDVTLDFPLPDALTRLALWQAHLGDPCEVDDDALERIALRCVLSGGQIRNAALHAALLAIEHARHIGRHELHRALEREYRKAGQQCPSLDEAD